MSERQMPAKEPAYLPATQMIIDTLKENALAAFDCLHGDGPAVGIYESPRGCVAFPGIETQPLCPQHVLTDGSFEHLQLVVDLTVDGAWSKHRGEEPDFCIISTGDESLILHSSTEGQPITPA